LTARYGFMGGDDGLIFKLDNISLTVYAGIMKVNLLIIFFVVMVCVVACSKVDHDNHNHPELSTGKEFYSLHCAECHRESGMGKVMNGIPPVTYSKLTQSQMLKFMLSEHLGKGKNMLTYPNMPEDEAISIISHIKRLSRVQR